MLISVPVTSTLKSFITSNLVASVLPDFLRSGLTEEEEESIHWPVPPYVYNAYRVLKRPRCQNSRDLNNDSLYPFPPPVLKSYIRFLPKEVNTNLRCLRTKTFQTTPVIYNVKISATLKNILFIISALLESRLFIKMAI